MSIKNALKLIEKFAFHNRCNICNEILSRDEENICDKCREDIETDIGYNENNKNR